MKSNKFIYAAIAALIPAAAALAQPVDRQQIIDAMRNGEISYGEIGGTQARTPAASSSVSRAQVQAELRQAQAAHRIPHGEIAGLTDPFPGFVSTRTRAEVRAETLQAMRDGELVGGEMGTSPMSRSHTPSAFAGLKARAGQSSN